jgi:cell shape-determining protein MreD
MITDLIVILARLILLVLAQVVILNNIQFSGYINPFLYIMFIMMLPVRIPKNVVLLAAFLIGLIVDAFSNTMGMHAAACVLMAYARPAVLKLMAPRDGYESETTLTARELGFSWFLTYAAILTIIHHLLLFYVEVFRFSEFFTTLLRMFLSSIATLTVIMLSQYLFGKTLNEK